MLLLSWSNRYKGAFMRNEGVNEIYITEIIDNVISILFLIILYCRNRLKQSILTDSPWAPGAPGGPAFPWIPWIKINQKAQIMSKI